MCWIFFLIKKKQNPGMNKAVGTRKGGGHKKNKGMTDEWAEGGKK